LTGSQTSGDNYAAAALEAVLDDPGIFSEDLPARIALFRVFHSIWATSGGAYGNGETGLKGSAQRHLSRLTSTTREALLLHTIEGLSLGEVASVLGVSAAEIQVLVDIAYTEMSKSVTGSVMIIEDEAIIALDLEAITVEMGHRATGVARTESAALALFAKEQPDLILSDVNLADGSSGIDAVGKIRETAPDIPIIFITAYPEKLLTGEGQEPAFLITKPYTEEQVRSAISQAMFFSSTQTLKA